MHALFVSHLELEDEQLLGRAFLDNEFFNAYTSAHILDINPILFAQE